MSPQSFSTTKTVIVLFVITGLSVLLIKGKIVRGIAQTPEEQSPKERVFENKIPSHVPISVKIKKEKETAFKDLNNKKWAHDFELEVTNTGNKRHLFTFLDAARFACWKGWPTSLSRFWLLPSPLSP